MSNPSDPERGAILDCLSRKISEQQVLDILRCDREQAAARAGGWLEEAEHAHDATLVSYGLYLAHIFGDTSIPTHLLVSLLGSAWHKSHEDIVGVLARRADADAARALFEAATARHEYLAFDEAYALGVKCVFALARIRTAESAEFLRQLAKSENEVLASAARARLGDD